MQIILLLLAAIDIVGGAAILLSSNLLFSNIATYIGVILLIKGFWSLILGLAK